jgi:hypothetical protein
MTDKVLKAPGLKSIRKQCEQIILEKNRRTLVVSAPNSEAIISSAILCKALLNSGGTFHITFVEPVIEVSSVNKLQKTYSTPTTFIIGVDVFGKKNIRKEKGYPVFIGGTHQSKQANILCIGNHSNTPAIAYILAEQALRTGDTELQLAAIGTLIHNTPENISDKIAKSILQLAEKEKLIEERKGFKLFGSSFQPLMETLVYSSFPYLSNISGTPEICEKLLNDADIPFSQRRMPINELSTEGTQRLTKQLIPQLNQSTISQVLGQDFILPNEREDSPIHTISNIRALTLHSWSQWKLGAMFSIWMGDRSRILREIIDSYLIHSKDVIAGFPNLEVKIKQGDSESESTESINVYKIPSVSSMILSDLGRICFSENLVDENRLLMLVSSLGIGVIWNSQEINLNEILLGLMSVGLNPVSSSPKSIRINDVSKEVQQTLLKKLQTIKMG